MIPHVGVRERLRKGEHIYARPIKPHGCRHSFANHNNFGKIGAPSMKALGTHLIGKFQYD